MKIVSEDRTVEARTAELLTEWEKNKPIDGELRPDLATNTLTIFEGKFARLKEDRDNIGKAKEALELQEIGEWKGVGLRSWVFFPPGHHGRT